MAKITRVLQRVFGSGAGVNQIAQFGSLFAGAPAFTTSASTAQSLSNWLTGWFAAAIGGNAPAIEDMNSAFFVVTYQLAYLMQAGIAEWDTSTVYYIGSLVNDGTGIIYVSLTDANQGNAVTDTTNWRRLGLNLPVTPKAVNYNVSPSDGFIPGNAGSGNIQFTLPLCTDAPGKIFYFKKVDGTANTITILAAGSDSVDGAVSIVLTVPNESTVLISDSVGAWSIF